MTASRAVEIKLSTGELLDEKSTMRSKVRILSSLRMHLRGSMAGSGMSYWINLTEWEYEKDEASEGPILGKLMQFARHSQ